MKCWSVATSSCFVLTQRSVYYRGKHSHEKSVSLCYWGDNLIQDNDAPQLKMLTEPALAGVSLWAASYHLLSAGQWTNPAADSSCSESPSILLTACPRFVSRRNYLEHLRVSKVAIYVPHVWLGLTPTSPSLPSEGYFVKAEFHQLGQMVMKKKTRVMKTSGGQCQWGEIFHFQLAALDHDCSLSVKLYSRSSVRRKQCLGQVRSPDTTSYWKQ